MSELRARASAGRRSLARALDLHSPTGRRWATYAVLVLLGVLAVVARISLVDFKNVDYRTFASWYDFARAHGIHSLRYGVRDGFSNYNPTYNYFLYLVTLLPLPKIVALKGLLIVFDAVMAGSVALLVRLFTPRTVVAAAAGVASTLLPTVLVTGVLWGQFDQFYTAFVLLSLWAALRGRSSWSWALFGIALSIKFQAVFFLPVLGVLSFTRIHWRHVVWAMASFALLTFPPVLLGRSVGSLLSIYPDQASLFPDQLQMNAPNPYQWVPESMYRYLNATGICVAIAACLLVLLVNVLQRKFADDQLLLTSALLLYLVPYLLPAMHERYFFPAGIAVAVLAVVRPTAAFISAAVAAQAVTLLSYCPFLFGTAPVPLSVLAVANLAVICVLGIAYLGPASPGSTAHRPEAATDG